jgi:hypothetical protein
VLRVGACCAVATVQDAGMVAVGEQLVALLEVSGTLGAGVEPTAQRLVSLRWAVEQLPGALDVGGGGEVGAGEVLMDGLKRKLGAVAAFGSNDAVSQVLGALIVGVGGLLLGPLVEPCDVVCEPVGRPGLAVDVVTDEPRERRDRVGGPVAWAAGLRALVAAQRAVEPRAVVLTGLRPEGQTKPAASSELRSMRTVGPEFDQPPTRWRRRRVPGQQRGSPSGGRQREVSQGDRVDRGGRGFDVVVDVPAQVVAVVIRGPCSLNRPARTEDPDLPAVAAPGDVPRQRRGRRGIRRQRHVALGWAAGTSSRPNPPGSLDAPAARPNVDPQVKRRGLDTRMRARQSSIWR